MNKNLKTSIKKAAKGIWKALPMILGVILLISLINTIVPKESFSHIFTGSFLDLIIGSGLGSILAGNPITSYIISGELLKQGISLFAVTAFIVAWVTVGIIQLPAEMTLLGKRFAILRNISAFILAIVVSLISVVVVNLI